MDTLIYSDVAGATEKLVGRIDGKGKVYGIVPGDDEYLGRVDYEEGEILDEDDEVIGWIEEEGEVIRYSEEDEEEETVGYVNEDGEVFIFNEEQDEVYLGRVKDCQDSADGAAALLLLFDWE